MSEEKLLTVREVSSLLGVSEKEVLDLADKGSLPAYKIAGVYLRFKKDQVVEFKKSNKSFSGGPHNLQKSLRHKTSDFFYFNDFYILSILIIAFLLILIFRGY